MQTNKTKQMKYTHRYLARITLEAETALCVGSGEEGLLSDALVQRDHHGFPMIQGSSLVGVLRHAIEDPLKASSKDSPPSKEEALQLKKWQQFFGFATKNENEGEGSKLIVSAAYLVLPNGMVAEGLTHAYEKLLQRFESLTTRHHVRITDKGVAAENGLFENELVYKGCRFLFEMELKGSEEEAAQWEYLLNELDSPLFRVGQGTRNGYGKLKVIACWTKTFDLRKALDFDQYLKFEPSLNEAQTELLGEKTPRYEGDAMTHYVLNLRTPRSFLFLFGSGYGDEEVNAVPLTELVMEYQSEEIVFEEHTIIPGSSIKGVIRHRTCFHYNKENKVYADDPAIIPEEEIGTNNQAVYELFGSAIKSEDKSGRRGKVMIDDLYEPKMKEKIMNHVAIDRFTGGALNGALFGEKVSRKNLIVLNIYLEKNKIAPVVLVAFERALKDICEGLLPLGGMTTKGHGIFEGQLTKNGIVI